MKLLEIKLVEVIQHKGLSFALSFSIVLAIFYALINPVYSIDQFYGVKNIVLLHAEEEDPTYLLQINDLKKNIEVLAKNDVIVLVTHPLNETVFEMKDDALVETDITIRRLKTSYNLSGTGFRYILIDKIGKVGVYRKDFVTIQSLELTIKNVIEKNARLNFYY